MRQILQSLADGTIELAEVPVPRVQPGNLLIRVQASVVSVGTERMLMDFGRANFLDKARQQPEKVKQVLTKIRTDGLGPTLTAVRSKLAQPIPLGYSNAGVVVEVGAGVEGYRVGDRVISNGPHAELVSVPGLLCAKIPDDFLADLSFEHAAFTVVASIGLQGVRLAQPTLGERFVVTGLGLIGLLTVQLLRANGCAVLGIDMDASKLELARQMGAQTVDLSKGEDPVSIAQAWSLGRGVDGVLITASTKSNEPLHQAAQMCRKRGRIVLVGVAGLELSRADFYEKELSFQVSCSYGPGRYDPGYEQKGLDYPFGFVRWTENRNFEAVLDLMAQGRLDMEPLISHRFDFSQAHKAYELIVESKQALGVVLQYPPAQTDLTLNRTVSLSPAQSVLADIPTIGLLGAGNYTSQMLLPALQKAGVRLETIVSNGGVSAIVSGRRFGFAKASTEPSSVFTDPKINTVIVSTRHDSHARYALEALRQGKHVFVEKPLAIQREELSKLEETYSGLRASGQAPLVGIGFNRRFAPLTQKMKSLLSAVKEPKTFIMTVNAGALPGDHWTQDPAIGGGRIIGEGCHFVDLLRYLVGCGVEQVSALKIGGNHAVQEDKMTISLRFLDGSLGTVHYFANGHKSFPKERLEVFVAERILVLDNFRRLIGYGWPGFKAMNLRTQDKGHAAGIAAFMEAIKKGQPAPIPFEEIVEVHRICMDAVDLAQ